MPKVDRYLVATTSLPGIEEEAVLVDVIYEEVIATGSEKQMRDLKRDFRKRQDAPVAQKHRR